MRTVYKYTLDIDDTPQQLFMPNGAIVHHVAMQDSKLCLWAEVETEEIETRRIFVVHGTGHPIQRVTKYVGTTFDRIFVWHVFEVV